MKHQTLIGMAGACLTAALWTLSGDPARAASDGKIIAGESVTVAGGTISTWARVNGAGKVIWVGLTMPVSLAENPPGAGAGPSGAIAVLNFPAVVQASTYFNHAEIHSNQHGHPANPRYADPNRYLQPHFDFHFYGIPVAQVWTIPFVPPFPPLPDVASDRLPVGYEQPELSIAQMGRHAAPLSEFTATDPWLATMIAGFLPDASYMHFLEPMVTCDFLRQRGNFTLPVPLPGALGRATQYPTECVALYDRSADVYHIVFKGFEPIE